MFPVRGAVFVDDCSANAFEKITMLHRSRGEPIFQRKGLADVVISFERSHD